MINPHIFKEYDIRGIVDKDFSPELIISLGKAFATFIAEKEYKTVVVGRDCRNSSPELFDQLISGLKKMGCQITDIGVSTSPMLYFSVYHLKVDAGIMITGSHNAKEYNGFKMLTKDGSVFGKDIQRLREIIEKNGFKKEEEGTYQEYKIFPDYDAFLKKDILIKRPLKIVVDAGNATGCLSIPILANYDLDVVPLYCSMDGNFPNHHPDPTVIENLADLQNKVIETEADIGIAFDGDTDRIGVVDENGKIIFSDYLMVLYAEEILQRKPGALFISEAKSSENAYRAIQDLGGETLMWKTGHSILKQKMKETGAEMACELTGHIFFKDRFLGFDDAIYAMLRLLEILSSTPKSLSERLSHLPDSFNTPEIRIDCSDNIKFQVVEKATEYFISNNYKVNTVDGARVSFEDGWGLIRASNTSPCLVLRFEANTKESLNNMQTLFNDKMNQILKDLQ